MKKDKIFNFGEKNHGKKEERKTGE